MKILITGKSGFIGQELSKIIPIKFSNAHIFDLECDLRDHKKVDERLKSVDPDIIIHLAALTEVEKSFYNQALFSEVNYVGTVNLVECAKDLKNLKNIIFSSTMETYGWQEISDEILNISTLKENDNDVYESLKTSVLRNPFTELTVQNPNAPYAVAKMACEKYLEYANRAYGIPFTYFRQTNTYGRYDNNFFVVEQIITQMMQKKDTIQLGYKYPWRNFLFIEDLLDLYIEVIKRSVDAAPECQGGFCCGPNNAIPIFKLVDIISEKLNYNGRVVWDTKPHRPGEIFCLNSTSNKAKKYLGWSPKIDLDSGLDITIKKWQ